MVPSMTAAEKLRAVQLWNILSEKLQEIVNSSAADINALAFQEPTSMANNHNSNSGGFFGCNYPQIKPCSESSTFEDHARNNFASCQDSGDTVNNNSPLQSSEANNEADNSLASFSEIQCADDVEDNVDNVCPLTLALNLDEKSKSAPSTVSPNTTKEKEKTKLFECSECKISFRTKGHLLDHSRKHTGERPFLCTECGSNFTTQSNLKRHKKSHTQDKKWTCHECQTKFLEKKTLLVHMRRHTGEKPYRYHKYLLFVV